MTDGLTWNARRWMSVWVFLGVLAAYIVVQRGVLASYDGKMMTSVAQNLVRHGSLKTSGDFLGFNSPYSTYGIGVSVLLVPLVVLQDWLSPGGAHWLTLLNPLVLAATTVVLIQLGRELGWRQSVALASALTFALGTMVLWHSTELFSEPSVMFCLALVMWGLVRWPRHLPHGPLLVGLGVGGSLLFRSDSLVLVAPVALVIPVAVGMDRLRAEWRSLVWCAAPVLVALSWIAWYNQFRYGSVIEMGYRGQEFSTPILEGLSMLLVEGGKGFFHYNVPLLLALPGVVLLWRRQRAIAIAVVGLSVARILFYARWEVPEGGVGWGPRLLAPICVLLVLGLGEVFEWIADQARTRRRAALAVVGVVGVLTAVVQVASVWVAVENAPIVSERPIGTGSRTNIDDYLHSFREGHLVLNLGMMDDGPLFPLSWWVGGPTVVGVTALIVSVVALTSAWRLARRMDRRATKRPAEVTGRSGPPPRRELVTAR